MTNYVLSCCSTADLTKEHFEKRDISYACFHYYLDGVEYTDDLGQSMPIDKFYESMANGAETKTSQINIDEFVEYFTPFLKAGRDVIHVSLSSGLSGVYNSAVQAREILMEEFPERKLIIVDSLCAASGYGLLMDALADKRDEGMDIEFLASWAEENKLRLAHWFFSSDLTFFVKGGRVSRVAGFVGTILRICPLMHVSSEGKLVPREKHRAKKNAIKAAFGKMAELAMDGKDYSGKCYISHSACEEDAVALARLIEEYFPKLDGKVEIKNIGTAIGSHTGPGTVALFFWQSPGNGLRRNCGV